MKPDLTTFWERKQDWKDYWEGPTGVGAPHRTAIVDALRTLPHFSSLLEVGCGPGVNLWRILEAFPDADLTGVDVSPSAVEQGAARFAEADRAGTLQGTGRVALCAGVLPDALSPTAVPPMGEVDVALSCYALAYIPPSLIRPTLQEMLRLAQRAVVLAEPTVAPGLPPGLTEDPRLTRRPPTWRYDYLQWFDRCAPDWRFKKWINVRVQHLNRVLVFERVRTL